VEHKIILSGVAGSGKTAAIAAVCDLPAPVPSATGQAALPLDYGVLDLGLKESLHLYATSGQPRLDDILTRDGIGLILLVDNSRPNPFEDMWEYLRAHEKFIRQTKVVIGVTHTDVKDTPRIDEYGHQFYNAGFRAPVFEVDARQRTDIVVLIQTLLYLLDPAPAA
jgi:uncharacterized protein